MNDLLTFLKQQHVASDVNLRMHDFQMMADDQHVMLIDTATIKKKDGLLKTIRHDDDSVSNDQLANEQIDRLESMIAKYKQMGRDDLVKIEVEKLANLRESLNN